ncbi:MAG: nucleoside-diphosphate sugar epimerase/dehydratase [Pirellulales bacterium]
MLKPQANPLPQQDGPHHHNLLVLCPDKIPSALRFNYMFEQLNHRHFLRSLALLVPLVAVAYTLAFLLRFAGNLDNQNLDNLLESIGWVVVIKLAVMTCLRLHQDWNRYVSFRDVSLLVQAVTYSSIGMVVADALFWTSGTVPRSVIFLDWGTTLVLLALVRAIPRLMRDFHWRSQPNGGDRPRALIVGANDSGEALLRAIRSHRSLKYHPVGFIDSRAEAQGRRIGGVPVLGTCHEMAAHVRQFNVEEVLITSGELPGKQVRRLVEESQQHGFHVHVLPSYEQLLHGSVAIQPRSVAINDLLRRTSVEIDTENISHWIAGRVLLVTGSAGSIGSEMCRQLVKLSPAKLLLLDRSETGQFYIERELRQLAPDANIEVVMADITDGDRMQTVFERLRPDIVFHAAAYKHVPLMEAHPGEAVKNIVLATRRLVDLAERYQCKSLVMISTDKAVNPTSIMGSCKRLAEKYVQAKASTSSCQLVTVRFGNVLDSAGSVVPIFRQQIARGGPVTVTHPHMVRYFMMIPEAAQLVIQAGAMGQGGEIYVLDMGEPVRIVDLAQDMIRLSGLRVHEDIEIEYTGLRPGEKLFEELYSDQELHQQTGHAKIMVAASVAQNLLEIINAVTRLDEAVDGPSDTIRRLLGEIVPLQVPGTAIPVTPAKAA